MCKINEIVDLKKISRNSRLKSRMKFGLILFFLGLYLGSNPMIAVGDDPINSVLNGVISGEVQVIVDPANPLLGIVRSKQGSPARVYLIALDDRGQLPEIKELKLVDAASPAGRDLATRTSKVVEAFKKVQFTQAKLAPVEKQLELGRKRTADAGKRLQESQFLAGESAKVAFEFAIHRREVVQSIAFIRPDPTLQSRAIVEKAKIAAQHKTTRDSDRRSYRLEADQTRSLKASRVKLAKDALKLREAAAQIDFEYWNPKERPSIPKHVYNLARKDPFKKIEGGRSSKGTPSTLSVQAQKQGEIVSTATATAQTGSGLTSRENHSSNNGGHLYEIAGTGVVAKKLIQTAADRRKNRKTAVIPGQ